MPASSDLYRYAGVGLHFAATIGVFAALGYWADARFGSSPWFLLLGVFLGFGLGLRSLIAKLGPDARPVRPSGADSSKSPPSPPAPPASDR